LIRAVLLGKALFRKRAALVDIHDIHRAVANITEHIDAIELTQAVCHSGKALRKNIRTLNLPPVSVTSMTATKLLPGFAKISSDVETLPFSRKNT